MRNVNEQSVTEAVLESIENAPDARLRKLVAGLVKHLHDFVREVELTSAEWLAGIEFLTRTGQKCDRFRQEFILLSDTLGVSMLVDAIANRKPNGATDSTLLGPFFTADAPEIERGESIARSGDGEPVVVSGRVLDTSGSPIAGAVIETWGTDGSGRYDVQYEDRTAPFCRGRLQTDAEGRYSFLAVKPVSYSIPADGPVGLLMKALGRHTMRPAHLHFTISAAGFAPLTTAIYTDGDPYLDSDAVFGVKESLVGTYELAAAPAQADAVGRAVPFSTLARDFVLAPAGVGPM